MRGTRSTLVALALTALASQVRAQAPASAANLSSLLSKNSCTACHAVDKKIVGPSFKDVAAKYRTDKDAATKLFTKIRQGGAGVWGSIPMPPQSAKDDEVKAIVTQILELK